MKCGAESLALACGVGGGIVDLWVDGVGVFPSGVISGCRPWVHASPRAHQGDVLKGEVAAVQEQKLGLRGLSSGGGGHHARSG